MFHPGDRITFPVCAEEFATIDSVKPNSKTQSKPTYSDPPAKPKMPVFDQPTVSSFIPELGTDGYVDDQAPPPSKPKKQAVSQSDNPPHKPAMPKSPPTITLDDGYVADSIAPTKIHRNLLYEDSQAISAPPSSTSGRLRAAEPAYQAPVSAVPVAAPSMKPQLRAAGAPVDTGYIDGASLFATGYPLGGYGVVASAPVDILTAIGSVGLPQYIPMFMAAGIAYADPYLLSQINDFFLQQLGIYEPQHRGLILASIARAGLFHVVIPPTLIFCSCYDIRTHATCHADGRSERRQERGDPTERQARIQATPEPNAWEGHGTREVRGGDCPANSHV